MHTKKDLILPSDIKYSIGIDTYVNRDSEQSGLVIDCSKRNAFFQERQSLHVLLEREATNPLLEEGSYISPKNRSRIGEHYLTHEALIMLVEKEIRNHKTSDKGFVYNSKNIFIVKNNLDNLGTILKDLVLNPNQDAKFIYIMDIHSIPFYIRNINNTIYCFIVDSDGDAPDSLIELLKEVYPKSVVFSSSVVLQKDFYSCTTFAFKCLKYFVKHGDEVFALLTSTNANLNTEDYITIDESRLPPTLLKMNQSLFTLSDEILQTKVSYKANLTLKDYLQRYTHVFVGKTFNSAALIKKYKYLDIIYTYLNKILDNTILSNQANLPLPQGLNERLALYSRVPNIKAATKESNFVDHYIEIISSIDNGSNLQTPQAKQVFARILAKFPDFTKNYRGMFQSSSELNNIKKILFVAAYCEVEDLNHIASYEYFAGKLFAVFGSQNNVVMYFKKYAKFNSNQPIHDLCLFNLPNSQQNDWNIKYWSKLALEYGPSLTKYLALAPQIDEILVSKKAIIDKDARLDTELKRIKYAISLLNYKRAEENPELAALCFRFERTENNFEENLDLVKRGFKSFDVLPDLTIYGKDITNDLKGFTLKKLAPGDLRGLFLGEYTSCCQSVNKGGAFCAIDGMTSAYSGFYVVYNSRGELIAQTWAWIAAGADIVFDSWEYVNKSQEYLCKPFLLEVAKKLIALGFNRVLLGTAGQTPKDIFEKTDNPAQFIKSKDYSDAENQYLIQVSPQHTMQARFRYFIQSHNLNYEKYANLYSDTTNDEGRAITLINNINAKELSFDDFFQLISFFYMNLHEILHLKTKTNELLLQTALHIYGNDMQHLLSLESSQGESVLGVFTSFDKPDNLHLLIQSLGENVAFSMGMSYKAGLLDNLVYQAIKYDALETLRQLYDENKEKMSVDDLAALIVKNNVSLLFFAAEFNAVNCFNWLVLQISKDNLSNLVDQQYVNTNHNSWFNFSNKDSIFHCLARNDALDSFKLLVQTINSKDKIIYLLNEVRGKAFINKPKKPESSVFASAFLVNNSKVFNYITHELVYVDPVALVRADILRLLIQENDLEKIMYLHRLCDSEQKWFEIVNESIHNVFRQKSYSIIFYILDSFKNKQNIINILIRDDGYSYNKPIDEMHFESFDENIAVFINKILCIFKDNSNQLKDIAKPVDFLWMTLSTNDINLVRKVLGYYAQSPTQFEKICNHTDVAEKLLGCILSHYDNNPHRESVSWHTIQLFTEELLKLCTVKQQYTLLMDIHWSSISGETASYVVKKLKSLPEINNLKNWWPFSVASFISRCFNNKKGPAAGIYLLEYHKELYHKNEFLYIVTNILKNCADKILSDEIKVVLINCTSEQRAELLDEYNNKMILKNLKDTKALDDYLRLLDSLDSKSRLDIRKRSSNTFFSGVVSDIEPLYYVDESHKLVLRTIQETSATLTNRH
jgi:hypothetical protein